MRPRSLLWNVVLSLLVLAVAVGAAVLFVRVVAWCVLLAEHWGWR